MDFKVLKRLIGLVEKSDIDELEVEHDDLKVRIKKKTAEAVQSTQVITTQAAVPAPQASVCAPQAAIDNTVDAQLDEDLEEVVSPMVGTFYSASSPGEAPYVKAGDSVRKGDILCLVEAMKLMNEIESPHDGKIVAINVDNAQPVEYGERLFLIKSN